MRALSSLRFVGAGLMVVTAAACSPPVRASTFSEIYPMLFPRETKAQCNLCHGLPENDKSNGKLSMGIDQATAYAALIGKTSTSSVCGGRAFISTSAPDNSLFLQKLQATPPCGDHMPLGGQALSADQVDMVRSWIAAGAKND